MQFAAPFTALTAVMLARALRQAVLCCAEDHTTLSLWAGDIKLKPFQAPYRVATPHTAAKVRPSHHPHLVPAQAHPSLQLQRAAETPSA
jgi:hypothetical protein